MDFKPLSGREFPRFSGIKTFFRLPHAPLDADYDVGILGVPFDGGVSYRPGARFAPSRIREMSSLGRTYHWSREDHWANRLKVADIGDVSTVPLSIEQTYKKIEATVLPLVQKKKKILSVGGDHSTTLPLLRSFGKVHGPLRLIHFDAHLDTYPAAWDCEYHHGAFLRHAIEEGLVKEVVQFGIRGPLVSKEDLDFATKHKFKIFTMDNIRNTHLNEVLKTIPAFDATPTYITFDVDALDPAFAPGTGTPVPGGLTSYEAQRILRELQIPNFIGGDVVEVCPASDSSDITSLFAMDVLFEYLGMC
ncbi:MAG: agmatinase [Bdellovibrionales bacterium]|nr:agmatinase [Bdellovibrionales bacterium]